MIKIQPYQGSDSIEVGRLISETYSEINLAFLPAEERGPYLGAFRDANSNRREDQEAIAALIQAPIVYLAKDGERIVGVLRGSCGRLHSLFVDQDYHKKGIGRKLVEKFETECKNLGAKKITLASTLFAVPFYTRLGYKKSTGVRNGWSFDGGGFKWQPMKKTLTNS